MMKYLRKIWIRALFSFFMGGVLNEILILLFSSNPNSNRFNISIPLAIFTFVIISLFFVLEKYWYYYRAGKNDVSKSSKNEDILDDEYAEE